MKSLHLLQKWELYLKYASARGYLFACFQGRKDYNEEKYNKYKEIFITYRTLAEDRGQFPETLEEFLLQCEEYEQSITSAVLDEIEFKKKERERIKEEKKQRTTFLKLKRKEEKRLKQKGWIREALKIIPLYEDSEEALKESEVIECKSLQAKKPQSRIIYDHKGNPKLQAILKPVKSIFEFFFGFREAWKQLKAEEQKELEKFNKNNNQF